MLTRLENLHAFVDETIDAICNQFPAEVQCRPGCADCCHAVFDISFVEAVRIAFFLSEHPEILQGQHEQARQAAVMWEELIADGIDPATARIRCPLLSAEDLCLGHGVRPVNCRTYGTPTVIDGKGHVCGLSGFVDSRSYPTVDLVPLQQSLQDYSVELVGEQFGRRRFPIAWVFLRHDFFLPKARP